MFRKSGESFLTSVYFLPIRKWINYKVKCVKYFVYINMCTHIHKYAHTHTESPLLRNVLLFYRHRARFWDVCQDTLCLSTFPRESLDPWLQAGSWGASLRRCLPGLWQQRAGALGFGPQTNASPRTRALPHLGSTISAPGSLSAPPTCAVATPEGDLWSAFS